MSQLVTRQSGPLGTIESRLAELTDISAYHVDPAQRFKMLRLVYEKQPELSRCSPTSLFQAFTESVRLDLDLGSECYIVPFKGEATFMAGYKGLVKILTRSGLVAWVNPTPVFKGEPFRVFSGSEERIEHERKAEVPHDRDNLVAVYTKIGFVDPNVPPMLRVMFKDQIEAVRGMSKKGQEHPWVGKFTYVSMALKTGIRESAKFLTLPPRAQEELKAVDRTEFDFDRKAPPALPPGGSAAERAARINGTTTREVIEQPPAESTAAATDAPPGGGEFPEAQEQHDEPICGFADAEPCRSACMERLVKIGWPVPLAGQWLEAQAKALKKASFLETTEDQRRKVWGWIIGGKAPAPKQ